MSDLSKFRDEQMKDPEFREISEEMEVHSDIAKAIVSGRLRLGLSQAELSRRTGIHQTDISRLENCEGSPSLKTLKKLAKGLESRLHVVFIPVSTRDDEEE